MIWTITALVAGLTWGFWLGRRVGEADGYRKGVAEAPLELREQALEADRCPVCGGSIDSEAVLPVSLRLDQAGS